MFIIVNLGFRPNKGITQPVHDLTFEIVGDTTSLNEGSCAMVLGRGNGVAAPRARRRRAVCS
jgi:hypothetical protein